MDKKAHGEEHSSWKRPLGFSWSGDIGCMVHKYSCASGGELGCSCRVMGDKGR